MAANDERDSGAPSGVDATLSADGGPRPQQDEVRVGDVLAGRYELVEEIGRGAFGVVFRARDRAADALVAVKVLARSRRFSTVAVARMRRELQAAWRVTHPGVVRVHDLITFGDHLALSMELVDGETLDKRVARAGRLDAAALSSLALELARALAAAHDVGVTHRDLKPSNIMLRAGNGRAVITDFGMSRVPGAADAFDSDIVGSGEPSDLKEELTREGELIGTPTYMAPEQLQRSRDVGPAADIYALGLVLFEAATGRRVHPERTLAELLTARLERPAPSLSSLRADVAPALARAIDDCLTIDPARRIADGKALLARLEAPASSSPRRARLVGAALLALLLVAGAAVPIVRWARDRLPARDRRVVFTTRGDGDLDRALVRLAQRRLGARDHRVTTVSDVASANVQVELRWSERDGRVRVTPAVGRAGRTLRALPAGEGASLSAALEPALDEVARVVDAGQPERNVDADERAAMARLGAHDVVAFREYQEQLDITFSTFVFDTAAVAKRLEDVIRRDPRWLHPYALLAMVQGGYSPDALSTTARAHEEADAAADPAGAALIDAATHDRDQLRKIAASLDRAFVAAPDDVLTGWNYYSVLGLLRLQEESIAALRVLHRERPDLQFGADLQSALRNVGLAHEVPALQAAWMKSAPENEQAWLAQLTADLSAHQLDVAQRRARELVLLYGPSPQRRAMLVDVLQRSDRLDEAASIAGELMRGQPFDRAYGWYALGQIAVAEGRFTTAREALRHAAEESAPFGMQGPQVQSFEELSGLDELLGDDGDLAAVRRRLVELYRATGSESLMATDEVLAAGRDNPRRCVDLKARAAAVEAGLGRASFEREVWRAAADVGCARCADVVRLGLAPDERSVHSLFRLGVCAAREGQLELARDAFMRARPPRTIALDAGDVPATAYSILSSFELGRVYERLGRRDDARAAYADLLAHWGHADRPLPVVDEARRALAALQQKR